MTAIDLVLAAIAVPLAMLLACVVPAARRAMPRLLALAPLPALACALFADATPRVVGNARFALVFALDSPGALLMAAVSLLWVGAGAYATTWQRDKPGGGALAVSWLLTLTGCIGVLLAADLIGLYLMLAVLSVGTSAVVLQGEGAKAVHASAVYFGLALLAEALLLVGFVLLWLNSSDGSLLIRNVVAELPASPARGLTLGLLAAGFGFKIGLVPLHLWMPLAHGAAPMPGSAVLSGAVVKAGIIGLIRFLPPDIAFVDAGLPLAVAGMFTALYAALVGCTQPSPKVVLAYSTVSQMGFLAAVIGMGVATLDPGMALAAAFYAVHHVLVKGALFLAVGVVMLTGRKRMWWVLVPAAFIALGFGGLPLTGGALAKDVAKGLVGDGVAGTFATLSSLVSTLLMLHFLRRLAAAAAAYGGSRAPRGLVVPWLAMAGLAVVLPWGIYLAIPMGTLPQALAPDALWKALWPVLAGAALAWGLDRVLRRPPAIPVGDVGTMALGALGRAGAAFGTVLIGVDRFARRWTSASLALLLVSAWLVWLLAAAR